MVAPMRTPCRRQTRCDCGGAQPRSLRATPRQSGPRRRLSPSVATVAVCPSPIGRYRRARIGEVLFGAMTDRSYAACATRRRIMQTRAINPTPWLQGFNINHGVEVTGVQRTLYLSGQTANAADGTPMHEGDLIAQFKMAWANLKDALAEAGMTTAN